MTVPVITVFGEAEGNRYFYSSFKWGGPFGLFCQHTESGETGSTYVVEKKQTQGVGSPICAYEAEELENWASPIQANRDTFWGSEFPFVDKYARFKALQNLVCTSYKEPNKNTLIGGGQSSKFSSGGHENRFWRIEVPVFEGGAVEPTRKQNLYVHHSFYTYNSGNTFPAQISFRITNKELTEAASLDEELLVEYIKPTGFLHYSGNDSYAYMLASVSSKGDKALVVVNGPSDTYIYGGRPTIAVAEIIEFRFSLELEYSKENGYSLRKKEIEVVKVVEASEVASSSRDVTYTENAPKVFGVTSYAHIDEGTPCNNDPFNNYITKTEYRINADFHEEKQITWDPVEKTWEAVDPLDALTIVVKGSRSSTTTNNYTFVIGAFYDDNDSVQQITLAAVDSHSWTLPEVSDLSISGELVYGFYTQTRDPDTCLAIDPHIDTRTEDTGVLGFDKIQITGRQAEVSAATHTISVTLSYGNLHTLTFNHSQSGTAGGAEMDYRLETRDAYFEGVPLELPDIWYVDDFTFLGSSVTGGVTVDFPFPTLDPLNYVSQSYNPLLESIQGLSNPNTFFWIGDVATQGAEGSPNGAVCTLEIGKATSIPTLGTFSVLADEDAPDGSKQFAFDNFLNLTYGDNWVEFFVDYHCGCEAISIAAFQGDYTYVNLDQTVCRSPILTKKGFAGDVTEANKFVGGKVAYGDVWNSENFPETTGLYGKNRDCASYNPVNDSVVYLSNTPVNWSGKWKVSSCWDEEPPPEEVLPEGASHELYPP